MRPNDVAVIIPVYNEAEVIRGVVSEVLKKYSTVVCVNDGSTDSSSEEIYKTKAILINHPINLGQGAALQTGIDYGISNLSNVKYYVTFDADGQHRLDDVEKMLKTIEKEKLDIVLGSRFLGESINIGRIKKLILKTAVKFSNWSSGLELTDTHNGLRVFTKSVAEDMKLEMSDYTHASEIVEKIAEKKWKHQEVPVSIVYTDYSVRKGQTIINSVNILFDVLLNKVVRR